MAFAFSFAGILVYFAALMCTHLAAFRTASNIRKAGMAHLMKAPLGFFDSNASGLLRNRLDGAGGGARSKLWMQMKADVLDLPITALKTVDAGTVGSAMLTGIAAGLFRDLEDAAAHMVQEMETYYPRADMHEKYMKLYERYKSVYNAVRPLV